MFCFEQKLGWITNPSQDNSETNNYADLYLWATERDKLTKIDVFFRAPGESPRLFGQNMKTVYKKKKENNKGWV